MSQNDGWFDAGRDESLSGPRHRVHPSHGFVEFDRTALDGTVPVRFAEQVRRHATRLAVRTPAVSLTYAELDAATDSIAAALLTTRGPRVEPVGVLLDLGAAFAVAVLAVWKAGKICVPLDPVVSPGRLRAVLGNAGAAALVSGGAPLALARTLLPPGDPVIDVDRPGPAAAAPRPCPLRPDHPACIIYTSGSTGPAKGVIQSHRSLLHQVLVYTNEKHFSADDRYAFLASPGGIYAVWSVLTAVLNGGSVFPLAHATSTELLDWVAREAITVLGGAQTILRDLGASLSGTARQFPSVRLLTLGGQAVYRGDVEEAWRHFPAALVAVGLGTTETGALTRYFLDRNTPIVGQTLPVGYPCPDKMILILGEDGTELGFDEVGEIAVRSRYLAAGYFRQPELTAIAFQPVTGGDGQRLYRTGDLGVRRPDGCLVHLGRKDFQVKIRGYRVETAEIEGTLLAVPGVRDVAVVAREDGPGDRRLVAYVVPAEWPGPTVSALRRAVTATLPPYMQPAAFVTLAALPLTPNRKLDRSRLPAPAPTRPTLEVPYVAPRTPVEAALARIWAEALGLETVGVLDTFGDLGGHSLVAARIAALLAETFRVDIPFRKLFEASTVAAMAALVLAGLAAGTDPMTLSRMVAEVEGQPDAPGGTLVPPDAPYPTS